MQYAESVVDLVGNTPLVRLHAGDPRPGPRRAAGAGQGRVPQPRRVGEGPHRRADDRRRRGAAARCSPAARSSSRPAATPASAWRSSPSSAATAASSSAPTRSARTRSTCCGPTAPRSSSARPPSTPRTRAPTTRCPTGWPARRRAAGSPTSTPTRTTRSRTTRRPARRSGSRPTGRITHFVAGVGTGGTISGIGRYLKEASGGRVQVIGADPEGSVYSGGTGRPYLVEGVGEDFWPATYDRDDRRRDHRGLRRRLVRDDPPAGPRGGPAGRRLVRHGRRRRAAGRASG